MANLQHTVTAAFFAALLTGACLAATALAADAPPRAVKTPVAAQAPKWGAHIDLEGKWGNRRSLGDVGLFAPLWQSPASLFFTDIRGRLDDRNSREGNFGLGLRHMLPSGWNAGLYGYYDTRRTSHGNLFQQATLGAELLSADFDLRVNGYLPFGTRERTIGAGGPGGAAFADFANGTIEIVTPGSGQIVERALRGFDGEVGWRLPVFPVESLTQIRAYAGGFWFDGENLIRDIAGPRGRIELSFEKESGPLAGARLTLGAEVQHDKVRGTNAFAVARLRIPLQPVERAVARLTPQERRMTERVVRDVDIVAGEGVKGSVTAETREAAINVYNNETVTDVVQVNAADGHAALIGQIANLGTGSIIIANGAFSVTAGTSPNQGQTLVGGGTQLPLKGAVSATPVTFTAPGAAGSLSGDVGGGSGLVHIINASDVVVGGLTLTNNAANGGSGIYTVISPGAVLFGNTISTPLPAGTPAIFNFGIYVHQDSHNTRVLNNTVTTAGGSSHGILLEANTGTSVAGNTVTTTGASSFGININSSQGASVTNNDVTSASTGIIFTVAPDGVATGNTVFASAGSGIFFQSSDNGTASGNVLQSGGVTAGVFAAGSTGLTVANNTFGPALGADGAISAENGSSFVSGSSTGNIDNSAGPRCTGDGTASGTVFFTTAPNCVYP